MSYSAGPAAGDTGYYTGGKVLAGGTKEFTGPVGQTREEYYLKAGTPDGVWQGKLAERLGLTGVVQAEDMARLFDKFEGPHGEKLGQGPSTKGRYAPVEVQVANWIEANPRATPEEAAAARIRIEAAAKDAPAHGIDLTYAPDKSISLEIAAKDRSAQEAESWVAHHEAAGRTSGPVVEKYRALAAKDYAMAREMEGWLLEANAVAWRWVESSGVLSTHVGHYTGGKDGAERFSPVTELAGAAFLEYINQLGEPHHHIHNPTVLRAMAADGKIRRPDGLVLRGASGAKWGMSAVASRVVMERRYSRGLPVEFRPDGIEGRSPLVSQELVDQFSQRTRGQVRPKELELVEAYREVHGHDPSPHVRAMFRQYAGAHTRGRKVDDKLSRPELLAKWEAKVRKESGQSLVDLSKRIDQALTRAERRSAGPVKWSPEVVKEKALANLSEKFATWTPEALMQAINEQIPPGAFDGLSKEMQDEAIVRTLTELTAEVIASPEAVQVAGLGIEAAEIEAAERFGTPTLVRYAARGTLAAEEAIVRSSVERGAPTLTRGQVEAWMAQNGTTLGVDQAAALTGVLTSDARVVVVEAPAGTGKSYLMGHVNRAWIEHHPNASVIGLAVGSKQADVLAKEGFTVTANTTQYLNAQARRGTRQERPNDYKMRPLSGDVVVVDEAAMIDMRQARQILDSLPAGVRLMFVQDPAQMQSVGAGGLPSLLAGKVDTVRLTEVRRHSADWENRASLRLRDGDAEVLAEYNRHGRLLGYNSPREAREAAAKAVFADLSGGLDSMAITATNEEAAEVAGMIRAHLVDAGHVDVDGAVQLAAKFGSEMASRGDVVQMRDNDEQLQVLNRQTWTVDSTTPDGGMRVVDGDGIVRDLPAEYVRESVALAYAGTIHATQGATIDRSHDLFTGGPVDRNTAYTMLSRGRDGNHAYIYCEENPNTGERPSPRAVMADILGRDGTDVSATVAAEQDQARRESTMFVMGRIEDVTFSATKDRLNRHLDELVQDGTLDDATRARLGADKGLDGLNRRLRSLEEAGVDPREALRAAVAARSLPGHGSAARVLSVRLQDVHGRPEPHRREIPADVDETSRARLEMLHGLVEERTTKLGAETAEAAPQWALTHLGPVPEAGTEARAAWEEKAGKVAAAREAGGWSDEQRALPEAPSPFNSERRGLWVRGFEAIDRPVEERPEALMSVGQLRLRVQAADRTLALAPAYADEEMRNASQKAEAARQAALVARDEIAKKAAERDLRQWDATRASLQRQTEARDAYLDQHRATVDNGNRAAEELETREVPDEAEAADLTTTAEWLGIEAESRQVDDEHRDITEADVDEHQAEAGDHAAAVEAAAEMPEWLQSYRPPVTETGLSEADVEANDEATRASLDWMADVASTWESEPEADAYDAGWEIG